MNDLTYIYGTPLTYTPPLGSYLPLVQEGVVGSWLGENLSPSDWVLCPFGTSPQVALEAASAGFRVLMPVLNPILRFLVNTGAAPPSKDDLNSALVKLASSYKGEERLKPHILSLYETDCPQCNGVTSALSFTWDRSLREPVQKTCRCNSCGEEAAIDVTETDLKKALTFSDQSPTHARALTRVVSPADPIRTQVETALATYPPRSVYALFTALNKLTGFNLPAEERSHVEILLLHAFALCSQSLIHQEQDADESSLDHGNYQEENVWYAMEDALDAWSGKSRSIEVTTWPTTSSAGGGITIFPGRIKDLTPQLIGFPIRGVVMVYPKPTPQFWSLSALWSGWLWGQEAAAPLRGILSSRDLDWPWMTQATQITLQELGEVLPDQIPVLGLMPTLGIESLLSWTSGSLTAGMQCNGIALDPDNHQGQSTWTINPSPAAPTETSDPRVTIREAGLASLEKAGEPKHTLSVYCSGMVHLAKTGYPASDNRLADSGDYYERLLLDFDENIAYRQGFLHYPEIESWWHQEVDLVPITQSDQVEIQLVKILLDNEGHANEPYLFQEIYGAFPGIDTPRTGLIEACLSSYAERIPNQPVSWDIRSNDQPANRVQDLEDMAEILNSIGITLGYQTSSQRTPENLSLVLWEEGGSTVERFYLSASALLSKFAYLGKQIPKKGWIILPGSRAGLMHYKMRYNPPLVEILQENWQMIKYRHLRRLFEQSGLTRDNYQDRFLLDPFTSDSPQLPLI
jgi:hypothetical protein